MYYKMIGDRQVFSTCKSIQLENDYPELELYAGYYVSNPNAELIAAEGWIEYIPPVIPPQPQTEPEMSVIIEAVKKMLDADTEALSDEDALEVAALFPTWASKLGMQVNVGERLWYDGKLYKVIQPHTIQSDWTPDISASLFTEVSIEEWPEIVIPIPSTNPYMSGDKVTYNGNHYICQIDNCVWTPDEYPSGWRLVE
jgi:hypothetical protein